MRVEFKNRYLGEIIKFLETLKLKAKASRHRTKLIKLLNEGYTQLLKDEIELLKEYGAADEEGKLIRNAQGVLTVNDPVGFNKDHFELMEEALVITDEATLEMLAAVCDVLNEYDGELSGKEADAYDYLCTQLEFLVPIHIEATE